jgi:hypothetical protein
MHEVWNVGAHGDPPSKSGGIVPVVQDFPARQDRRSGAAFRLSVGCLTQPPLSGNLTARAKGICRLGPWSRLLSP